MVVLVFRNQQKEIQKKETSMNLFNRREWQKINNPMQKCIIYLFLFQKWENKLNLAILLKLKRGKKNNLQLSFVSLRYSFQKWLFELNFQKLKQKSRKDKPIDKAQEQIAKSFSPFFIRWTATSGCYLNLSLGIRGFL